MHLNRRMASLLAFLLLLLGTSGLAQKNSTPGAASGSHLNLKVTEVKLQNGLRLILHEDHSTPVVAVNIWYHVGSKNETPGKTGFAHLFEHMMFQGSKNWNEDYFFPLQEAGGSINGSTNADRTNYYEVVPSNFLELALYLEADRMSALLDAMTEEKLANQRDVVKNEKRQRIDNQPYGVAYAKIAETMYPPTHPYHWIVIGSLEDLTAASMEDVQAFFRRYYVPNNATLTIAGDIRPEQARQLVEKYFGPIPAGKPVPRVTAPTPTLEREVRLREEDRVTLPRTYMAWHTVPAFSEHDAALDMLASVLASGKGSRLYRRLVYEEQIAQDVAAFHPSREIAGEFRIMATARPGKALVDIEKMVDEEIAKIKAAPPTQEDVQRAYNEYEASFIYGLQTVLGKADQLNQYATYIGQPVFFRQHLAAYRRVTPADVQRVARRFLTANRLVLNVVPRTPQRTSGDPVAPGTKTETPAPATQQAAGTAPRTTPATTGDRPTGAQPQTKSEQAQTRPAGSSPGAPAGSSQTVQEPKARPDTSRLPKPGPDSAFRLPELQRRKLSNGLEVLIVEHHELPVLNMNLVVRTGGAADPAKRPGLANMTASMLDEGTRTRSALDIANALATIGATLNTTASWDSSSASMLILTRHLDRALDIFTDVLLNASFPDAELRRLRDQLTATLQQRRDNPNAIAGTVYPSLIFGRTHPYGHPLIGDEMSARALVRGEVVNFYDTFYRPNNSVLLAVGDVTPDQLMPKLEKAFAGWKPAQVPAVDVSAAAATRARNTIYVVDRPGAAQSVLTIGHVGVPRSTEDFFAILVLNTLLGGQFTSRVNMNLRESKGYTYGARTAFDLRRGSGPFSASAAVHTAMTKEAVVEFMRELRGVRGDMPIAAEELAYAKQSIIRGFPRGFETPAQIGGRLEEVVIHDLSHDYFNTFIARVNAVGIEDVKRAARRYIDPDRLAILVVGDRHAIEPGLRELGAIANDIVFVDAEGRPIPAGPGSSPGR